MNWLRVTVRNALRRSFPKLMHARAIVSAGWAEIEEDLLPVVVDPGRDAIDVGANIGRYTVALARLSRRVYAFEPVEELSSFLRRAAPENVRVFSEAVSDTGGETQLRIPIRHDGSPMLGLASLADAPQPGSERTELSWVKTTALDRFRDENIGFIKIDVEGHELEVLRGAQDLLQRQKPIILVEIEERHRQGAIQEVRALLESLGYAGFFVLGGKTHDVNEFRLDLQNSDELEKPIPRREMNYINNFFFAPSRDTAHHLREKIERHFSARG